MCGYGPPFVAFTAPSSLVFPARRPRTFAASSSTAPQRVIPACALPPLGDDGLTQREGEIAAKIEMLRRQQRLKSQKRSRTSSPDTDTNTTPSPEGKDEMEKGDANEEGFFLSMIQEGEALFGTAPTKVEPSTELHGTEEKEEGEGRGGVNNNESKDDYEPKVSTWGVYPRPKNISRAYGGGKKIPVGGVGVSEEARAMSARVAEKLARYRGGTMAEAAQEAEHGEEIEAALSAADSLMRRGRESEATRVLRQVVDYTTAKSRMGGEVRLALALALEGCGRRIEARKLYGILLRENRFNEVRQKAKRLNAGFADMEKMKMMDQVTMGEEQLGFRSSDFSIPDIGAYLDKRVVKRYREEVVEMSPEEKRAEAFFITAVFAALLGIPAVMLGIAKYAAGV